MTPKKSTRAAWVPVLRNLWSSIRNDQIRAVPRQKDITMTAKFTTTQLAGERFLVKGTDSAGTSGSTVVDGEEWLEMQRDELVAKAHAKFDKTVERHFAKITKAAEEAALAGAVELDPLLYDIVDEGEVGVASRPAKIRELEPGTVVLRAIATGQSDRLVWVNDQLEVIA